MITSVNRVYSVILITAAAVIVRCCLEKSQLKSTRTWKIDLETGTGLLAGLRVNVLVTIRVGDEWSKTIEIKSNGDYFKTGAVDTLTVKTSSRGVLTGFQLQVIDNAHSDSWYLLSAKVQDVNDATQTRACFFNKWLSNHKDAQTGFLAC